VKDCYREHWSAELAVEQEKLGVDWHDELSEKAAFELGLTAIEPRTRLV
jgi:hypothetical protein